MAEEEKKKLTQKQAAYLHFNKPKEVAVKAEEPKQPTREENRRVMDALDSHYDVEKQCYLQNFSDESLAGKINVPRAWVADIRERLYGPDISHSKREAPAKLKELEAQLKALVDESMATAQKADDALKAVKQMQISIGYQGAA